MTVDAWAGSSDIFTDYEGTIVDATFQTNEFGTQMKLTFDEIDGRPDPLFEFYKVPDSYESNDGGDTITRIDGADKAMSRSSKWMRFVLAAAACGSEVRAELGEDAPTNANAWIGSRWRMEAVEGKPYKVKDKVTGEQKEGVSKDMNFPVAYLGKDSSASASAASTNGHSSVDSLSVLADLNNPVLGQQIAEMALVEPQAQWFNKSYQAIIAAGIAPASIPDLITAMGGDLYVKLGGKG